MDNLLSRESTIPEVTKRCLKRARDHASVNQWLFVSPCAISKTVLTPHQFRDGLSVRYGRDPLDLPAVCECGKQERNTLGHALTCKTGGGVVGRHDIIRDELAYLAGEALSHSAFHVMKEEPLQQHQPPLSQRQPGDSKRGGIGGRHQLLRERGEGDQGEANGAQE